MHYSARRGPESPYRAHCGASPMHTSVVGRCSGGAKEGLYDNNYQPREDNYGKLSAFTTCAYAISLLYLNVNLFKCITAKLLNVVVLISIHNTLQCPLSRRLCPIYIYVFWPYKKVSFLSPKPTYISPTKPTLHSHMFSWDPCSHALALCTCFML